jgi:AraC family transcriptional regulator of adaptative response/methylated-DNA-[protein]-cysteine methyltransferase
MSIASTQNSSRNCYPETRTRDEIRFGIAPCFLGMVLVATSPEGVCGIILGDDEKSVVAELRGRFPRAIVTADKNAFAQAIDAVVRTINTGNLAPELRLAPRGTSFQLRVWKALREIPAGSTATYKEIAETIGSGTAQEIGEACAANPIAVLIPCHRVVRSDRSLAGYHWGIKRKRALLEREKEAAPEPGSLFHAAALGRTGAQRSDQPESAVTWCKN